MTAVDLGILVVFAVVVFAVAVVVERNRDDGWGSPEQRGERK